ncbi:hypothetical protein K4749_29925 [Streptomyces sp. TRM72054]|uniref:hypothetical protein n=1 Tax=Streptomyces sp. TRM72054 TaxID=2870562 RepID=UPI001C8BF5FC|nr:hypothetical protein [Streptomyces sp. TRM72054]MBX9397693.1 hypothetical protein [Streptomyces sp. TRM72054]
MRRRKRHTRALLPVLSAAALLLAGGCSSPPQGDSRAAVEQTRQARADQAEPAGGGEPLAVAAAPADAPTATANPDAPGEQAEARKTDLTVDSYDSRTRRAVISGPRKASSGPSASPSPDPAVGDVIASAPAPGAPDGLLAKVTKVIGETDEGTEVQTEPATLNTLLGDDTARGSVPVDPAAFDIDKLLPDVDVSWSKAGDVHVGPEGATVPLGSLRLDVRAELPAVEGSPASAAASVSGHVQIAPQVDFRYGGQGTGATPASAYLGVSGDWTSGWALHGRAALSDTPLRIPFAKLHADPVLQVGPVPVVVNLDLTCYLQLSGDGRITVDVEQSLKGDFKAGGTFGLAQGWTPVSESEMTSTPVRTSLTTAGNVQATLGAEASIGLYGTVGVAADLAPYLRGEATATAGTPAVWSLYGGVDLTGTLRIQLSIFGTPVFQHSIPLGALHREWKLAGSDMA